MKDLIDKLVVNGSVKVPKEFLEKNLFIIFKYHLEKYPDGEFLKNYDDNKFEFNKALKYYIYTLIKQDVSITEEDDFIKIKIIIP